MSDRIWSTIASDMRFGDTTVNMPSRLASAVDSRTATTLRLALACSRHRKAGRRHRWVQR
jgi:hypothetical protein